jgi:hypothetical protein
VKRQETASSRGEMLTQAAREGFCLVQLLFL